MYLGVKSEKCRRTLLYSSELMKSSSWYIVEALVVKWMEECGSLRVYIACKTLCLSTVKDRERNMK